ncbi:MAG: hypothetical protein R3284_07005, partial [Rubricoccaceae bacterium]|nr:hypothetical protein [Rubricoccaceae bacterium]
MAVDRSFWSAGFPLRRMRRDASTLADFRREGIDPQGPRYTEQVSHPPVMDSTVGRVSRLDSSLSLAEGEVEVVTLGARSSRQPERHAEIS